MLGLGLGLVYETNLMGGGESEGQTYINLATAAGYSGGSAACADVSFEALTNIA